MHDDSAGAAPVQKGSIFPDIVVGLGARENATRDEVLALLDGALASIGANRDQVAALATIHRKRHHPAMIAASAILGVSLLALPESALSTDAPNPSALVGQHIGLPSVAEAVALVFGPLLLDKQRSANATCALSRCPPAYAVTSSSALSAASTLSTSSAGA